MRYLLDVNILVAWGWVDHLDHERTVHWLASVKRQKESVLMTSPIPELGFIRVSVQRTQGHVTVMEASETLAGMVESLGSRHLFLSDDSSATDLPEWCRHASRTTDAHLVRLADAHEAKLATLDAGITGALLIPTLPDK